MLFCVAAMDGSLLNSSHKCSFCVLLPKEPIWVPSLVVTICGLRLGFHLGFHGVAGTSAG